MVLCETPRTRNATATRLAILEAARDRFCAHSYDDVGMRDIARRVGVDAALISRYFGSKEDLFIAALDSCKSQRELWDGARDEFGQRVAREILLGEGQCGAEVSEDGGRIQRMGGMLILLRSIGSTKAMEVIQRTANTRFFDRLSDWLGGINAPVRAHLIAGLIMGMTISRELTEDFSRLDDVAREAMIERLARMLQDLATV